MSTDKLRAAILVISETAYQDPSTDKCGPILQDVFSEEGGEQWEVVETTIVPDSVLDIQRFITQRADSGDALDLIITSGGTGFATKDNTPEAVAPLIHRYASGLVHGMLAASLAVTPFALMSRPVAGARNRTLILTLPGSPKGAKENLQSVLKLLPHACIQAAGADSRALHAGGIRVLEKEAGVQPGAASVISAQSHVIQYKTYEQANANTALCGLSYHGFCEELTEVREARHRNDGHHHHHHGPTRRSHSHQIPQPNPISNDPSVGPSRRHRSSPYPMLSVADALAAIRTCTPRPTISVSRVNGGIVGLVLAEDAIAAESVPAFRASIVDGYAIKFPESGSFAKGVYPVALVSHAQAGETPPLQEGQIARITTGAPLPRGADAVVMVEETVLRSMTEDGKEEKEVEILADDMQPGDNVREIGSDVQAGDVVMKRGEGITAIGGELGLLASVGIEEIKVYKKPVVGVLSTGDEIVQHDRPGALRLGEVRDTNRPTLLTAVRDAGFEAVDLGIASDKAGVLEDSLRSALRKVDVIITSGGVSMGELDLLKPTIERALGGTIHFGRVAMKPGKPTTFATVPYKNNDGERETKVVFSLPGNPASAVVTFQIFVLPSLHHTSGISPGGLPKVRVVLDQEIRLDPQRTEFQRAIVVAKADGLLYASTTGGQRSSRIGSFKGANALLSLPAGKGTIAKGERVDAFLMGKLLSEYDNSS